MTKHVVCYSGGHSSALVAVEVARRFGAANTILLNHDINPRVEDADIKRFKRAVADKLGLPITYANYKGWATMDQFDIALKHSAFKSGNNVICTHRLKTEPFERWLAAQFPGGEGCVIYYGFDANEMHRVQRRASILGAKGYKTDYPLALWKERTIRHISEIGVAPPLTYSAFRHANCVGCIKASRQHWYVVYCLRPDIYEKAQRAEEVIGYSIMKHEDLTELRPLFERMKRAGVDATEKLPGQTFWAQVRRAGIPLTEEPDAKPCECTESEVCEVKP